MPPTLHGDVRWKIACADIDRCIEGVEWHLEQIGRQLDGRRPLSGPVSNIALSTDPLSVRVHAELVQLLAGRAVIAVTLLQSGFPALTQSGFPPLTLTRATMAHADLPVTLLSGVRAELADALVFSPYLGAVAFVGCRHRGRSHRRDECLERQFGLLGCNG